MKRWQDVEETCSRNGVVQVVENQAQSHHDKMTSNTRRCMKKGGEGGEGSCVKWVVERGCKQWGRDEEEKTIEVLDFGWVKEAKFGE